MTDRHRKTVNKSKHAYPHAFLINGLQAFGDSELQRAIALLLNHATGLEQMLHDLAAARLAAEGLVAGLQTTQDRVHDLCREILDVDVLRRVRQDLSKRKAYSRVHVAKRGIEPFETLVHVGDQLAGDGRREREIQQHADAAQDLGAQREECLEGGGLVFDGEKLAC